MSRNSAHDHFKVHDLRSGQGQGYLGHMTPCTRLAITHMHLLRGGVNFS